MAPTRARTAVLVRGIEAMIVGDSSVIAEIYTDDVEGSTPALRVSSAAALAVELEDRDDTCSDVELVARPLRVGGEQACVEWIATVTRPDARVTLEGVTIAEFDGDRICSFREYWTTRPE
jgi:hypothetical protein